MNSTVATLIDENTKWWDIEKVRRILPPREATEVLNMILTSESRPDSLVWEHKKSGAFSVKSAYRFFQSLGHVRQTDREVVSDGLGLWYRRNQKLYKDKVLLPEQVVDHALSLHQEHKTAAKKRKEKRDESLLLLVPPPVGVLKLNIDGALFHDQCRSGVGMVLRDEYGKVIFFASKPTHEVQDPMEIELIAIL
ncbi:hypothetical protein F2P56_003276 [Juglans regia]|uniref:RNase H type-1 domain-containing protein n=1 Tax=Juglans regia TaxID=51240 RepID=A0A834D0A1_JUGRE|nr:hypothetical protein F2P56_003276 [Juglans regia]